MGLFSNQFSNVVEWQESRDDIMFWKWKNDEIKKGSKLIIRKGQDAIFMYNGKVEGIFQDEGSFDIESQIIPFLSTLKGIKFGFNSGVRCEVLFINTKEFTVSWGTKNPISIQTASLQAGMPIRAFGKFTCKLGDYDTFIDKIAGVKDQYTIDEIKERVVSVLNPLLMKWVTKEGKDMFNLQASAYDISNGIKEDLDMETSKDGISVTGFSINSFNYPEEVQKKINQAAANSMVGDLNSYTQISMVDAAASGNNGAGSTMGNMAEMMMGATMASQMMNNMNQSGAFGAPQQAAPQQAAPAGEATGTAPKFCPECGTPTNGAKFCPECGNKLI